MCNTEPGDSLTDQALKGVGRVSVPLGIDMQVSLDRDTDACMPEAFAHHLNRNAALG